MAREEIPVEVVGHGSRVVEWVAGIWVQLPHVVEPELAGEFLHLLGRNRP